MSKKPGFFDQLGAVIFGPSAPDSTAQTLQEIQQTLQALQQKLETPPAPGTNNGQDDREDLAEQVRKLAKTQFKTNTLQEKQLAQQEETLASLQKSLDRQEKQWSELRQQRQQAVTEVQLELLKSLLPVLDGLDAAFYSGKRQVLRQPMPTETRRAVIAWLDGVRLARLRFLEILQTFNVTPIPTVGHPFDPHRHVARAIDASGRAPDGAIVAEDRRGYATPDKVLRFAEVVVSRKAKNS